MLLVVFVYGLLQYARADWLTDDDGNNVTIFGVGAVAVVGIGALVLGLALMVLWRVVSPDFFRGVTLPRRSHDLVLETVPDQEAAVARFGLPDAGDVPTIIAGDLSNLPPGEKAIDPLTGQEYTKN